jgi:primosomal protein N'
LVAPAPARRKIYEDRIAETIAAGKTALLILPEIDVVDSWGERFKILHGEQ